VYIFLHFFSNVIEYEYGNKIIDNWYFKSLVKRAKKRGKKDRNRERNLEDSES